MMLQSSQRYPTSNSVQRNNLKNIESNSTTELNRSRGSSVSSISNHSRGESSASPSVSSSSKFDSFFNMFSSKKNISRVYENQIPRSNVMANIYNNERDYIPTVINEEIEETSVFEETNPFRNNDHKNSDFDNNYLYDPVDNTADPSLQVRNGSDPNLPLLLTFTNLGRCTLDSNRNISNSNSSIFSETSSLLTSRTRASTITGSTSNQAKKVSKTMVHFIYGSRYTQHGLKPLVLDLPQDTRSNIENNMKNNPTDNNGFYSIRLTPFLESASNIKSLLFRQIVRRAGPNSQLVICRNTRHVENACQKIPKQFQPLVFPSKVISRIHGYIKVDNMGNWYIQDVKSASGTFLNHKRISQSGQVSKDIKLNDGDTIQLGLTLKDGTEQDYKCVRIKVELNDSWKLDESQFRNVARERITNLIEPTRQEACAICLYKCKPCQPLFISPCAHYWHLNCIKPLLLKDYPHFVCPNCRAIFDLDEETNDEEGEEDMITDSSNSLKEQTTTSTEGDNTDECVSPK